MLPDKLNNFNEVILPTHPIYDAMKVLNQPRTKYQINKFVIGQHDTDEQKYKQVLLEIKSLISHTKRALLTHEKLQIQYQNLLSESDPIKEIDAKLLKLDIEDLEMGIDGNMQELSYFLQIWESWEHKYTAEEIEQLQPAYWNARLNRQASLEAIGNGGTIAWASLDALNQIGELPSLDPNFYLAPNLNSQRQGELS